MNISRLGSRRLLRFSYGSVALAALLVAGCPSPDDSGTDGGGVSDGGGTDGGGTDGGGTDGGGTDGGGTDGGGGTGLVDVTCPGSLPQPSTGRCSVTPGNEASLLIQGTVLAPDGIYRGGGVLLERASGRIVCTGCGCADNGSAGGATTISCPNSVISPALINPHDHSTFALSKPIGHGTERYEHRHDWRKGKRGHTKLSVSPGSDSSAEGILYGELRHLLGGATSVTGSVGRGNASGLLRNLDSASSTEGLNGVDVDYRTFPLGDANGSTLTSGCAYPKLDSTSRLSSPVYFPHIAEGIGVDAENEFLCVSSAVGADLIEANTTIVHGIGLTATDVAEMSANGASLVWSPRSNISLYGETAAVTVYNNFGVPISLGTDWPASGSMNPLRELACADSYNKKSLNSFFSDRDLWMMVTSNAAAAMGAGDQIGQLTKGYFADIAVFDASQRADYRAIVGGGVEDVVLVLRGGEPLYGDADALGAWIPSADASLCESLDVCGTPRSLCLARDTGKTLADIQNAVDPASYPLFFCGGAVTDEPSCVPARVGEFDGVAGPGDQDGDGVPDASDLCPKVFDPPMPMNAMVEADADNDGIGDACDLCPLTAGEICAMLDPNDIDGDGTPNTVDVCPRIPDDQTDTDGDKIGDACDLCPTTPNPNGAGCPFTVQQVRDPSAAGHPAEGTAVTLLGLTVTAIDAKGFYAQDTSASTPDFSGVYVYQNAAPGVALGDVVDIAGSYTEFYNFTEIGGPTVTVKSSGAVPAPLVVTVAEVKTGGTRAEALESVLVELDAVSITQTNPDGPTNDYQEFEVGGQAGVLDSGLRVDDRIFDYNTAAVTTDPDFRVLSKSFSKVVGPMTYSFSNRKVLPRDAADLVP